MHKFVMGVSSFVEEECHTTIFNDHMDISRLMVYYQQIEKIMLRKTNRRRKRDRSMNQVNLSLIRGFIFKIPPW